MGGVATKNKGNRLKRHKAPSPHPVPPTYNYMYQGTLTFVVIFIHFQVDDFASYWSPETYVWTLQSLSWRFHEKIQGWPQLQFIKKIKSAELSLACCNLLSITKSDQARLKELLTLVKVVVIYQQIFSSVTVVDKKRNSGK